MIKTNPEKIFAVYVRVSTGMQSEDGESLEMQETLANELIKKEGGVLYKIYSEPAVSASKTKLVDRKELMKCLVDAKDGLFTHLIVYRRDRLARNAEDSIVIRNTLKKAEVKVLFTASGEQEMDFNDPYAVLIENLRASMDEIESTQTSMRVADTMLNKAKKGEFTGGILPYGYEKVGNILQPIESEIPTIKEIEDLYLQGFGYHSICKWLDGEKVEGLGIRPVPVKRHKQHRRAKDKWTYDLIRGILFNPIYTGYLRYSSQAINQNESIVVKSDFVKATRKKEIQNQLNSIREKRRSDKSPPRKYNTPFLLTGFMQCQECGSQYMARTSQRKCGLRYSYYMCSSKNKNKHHTNCPSKQFKKELLETLILGEVKKQARLIADSDVFEIIQRGLKEKGGEIGNQLKEIEKKIYQSENDLQAIKRLLYELDVNSPAYQILKEEYVKDQVETIEKLASLKKTKSKLSEQLGNELEETADVSAIIKQLGDFGESIESAPVHIQKQMVESLFSTIVIDKQGDITITPKFNLNIQSSEENSNTFMKGSFGEANVISLAGFGTPTTSKDIKINLSDISFTVNYFQWIESLKETIKDTFFEYVSYHKPEISRQKKFVSITGYSHYTYTQLKTKKATVGSITLINILESCGSNLKEYVDYINSKNVICSKNAIEEVLWNRGGDTFTNKKRKRELAKNK